MRTLLFLLLLGYAVRSDDTSNNYYVIEMTDDDPPVKEYKKPFKVFWNVPTMQCKSKKIPFEDLYERFGIIQNSHDSFRGEKISILYDPGLFPALLKNETSGKFKFRNGGVPQEGNLEKHLITFRSVMEQSIPDQDFSGVGIIDFESWRPIFRQNFGVLVPYKDVSYEIEKKIHWFWPKAWIQAEARRRFESSAREFMQSTLQVAKQMRPNALWGYYGFPYCFNMASNHMDENCADKVPEENDMTHWLWSESTALYPSVYSSKDLSSDQLASLVRGRVKEASRVQVNKAPILPYFWYRYRDGGFLKEDDLEVALKTLYKSNASGFIIWGSSNDVNTVSKCNKLLSYIEDVMGPAIAKYTKPSNKDSDEIINDLMTIDDNYRLTTTSTANPLIVTKETTTGNSIKNVPFDPDYHWDPPENYTQNIVQFVEEQFVNQHHNNDHHHRHESDGDKHNVTVLNTPTENTLLDIIFSSLFNKIEEEANDTRNSENKDINNENVLEVILTSPSRETTTIVSEYETKTDSNINIDENIRINESIETTTVTTESAVISTESDTISIESATVTIENTTVFAESATSTTESATTTTDSIITSTENPIITTENTKLDITSKNIEIETTTKTSETTTAYSTVPTKTEQDEITEKYDYRFYNDYSLFDPENSTYSDTTEPIDYYDNNTDINTDFDAKTMDLNITLRYLDTTEHSDIDKHRKKEMIEDISAQENDEIVNASTISTLEQVAGSSVIAVRPKIYLCMIFYIYSVSKCLCEMFGQC